jgi:dihydroorotase
VLFDAKAPWQLTPDALVSHGKSTPMMGHELVGQVRNTIVGGDVVWDGASTPSIAARLT